MQHITAIDAIQTDTTHDGSTFRKKLITTDQHKGHLATYNYAWLDPDKQLTPHAHPDGEEFYFFLEGTGEILIGQTWHPVQKGIFATIPQNHTHSVKNTGDDPLVFMTIRTIQHI